MRNAVFTQARPDSLFYPHSKPPLGCVLDLKGRPFSGGTILDNSPYGNHGAITGATWERLPSGLWWNKLDDTDDVIDCGTSASLAFTTAFSFVFWFKIHTNRNYHDIYTRAVLNTDGYWLGLEESPGVGSYRFIFDTEQAGAYTRTTSTGGDFVANAIYMGAVVFNTNTTTFYKNGLPLVGGGAQTAPLAGTRTFYRGKGNLQNFPSGMYLGLDGAFNRALSAAQVMSIFQQIGV